MNRFVSNLILGFFILVLVVVYGIVKQPAIYSLTTPAAKDAMRQAVMPNGKVLDVTVADSEEERVQGLSGQESLPSNEGMLFIFPDTGQHGIWMKGMNFPIDILWLSEEGKIVNVVEDAPVPNSDSGSADIPIYNNAEPAKYVLETAAGTAETCDVEVGKKIVLS